MRPIDVTVRKRMKRERSVLGLLLGSALFLTACQGEPAPEQPNFVVIVSDALRPDHLGCYGYKRPTSPNIDALAARGVRFETAITNAPWTKGSFSSLFSSLHTFQHGVTDWISTLPDTLDVLPAVLAGEGYSTMCVMNMVGLEGRYGVLRGFTETSVTGKEDRDATATTEDAIKLLRASPEPFLLVIHYFDTHQPYEPPAGFIPMIANEADLAFLESAAAGAESTDIAGAQAGRRRDVLLYDACIRYVDSEIGRLVDALHQAGIMERTVVIVTADHGDALMEHGTRGHGRTLYDEELKIPLIISLPGPHGQPKEIAEQVRMIDLAPTLLELAGVARPPGWEGTSLVGLMDGTGRHQAGPAYVPPHIALTETSMRRGVLPLKSVRTRDWKVIVEPATGAVEAYHLAEDPGETVNLWPERPGPDEAPTQLLWGIPGATVSGWRLAFLGEGEQAAFRATVEVPEGGRITELERSASRGSFTVHADKSGRVLHIESKPVGINLLMFETQPENLEITVDVTGEAGAVAAVYSGKADEHPAGARFRLSRRSAVGLPEAFQASRRSQSPGAFIWWLPGGKPGRPGESLDLSPEEIKRLKALGYIQ